MGAEHELVGEAVNMITRGRELVEVASKLRASRSASVERVEAVARMDRLEATATAEGSMAPGPRLVHLLKNADDALARLQSSMRLRDYRAGIISHEIAKGWFD